MKIKQQQGFTLIEVMITVVIIAILASIALPSYQNYVKKSKLQEGQSNLVSLSLAVEAAYQRQLAYPSAIPSTWSNSGSNFTYTYTPPSGTTPYSVTATGNSGPVNGCVLQLTQAGAKTLTSCGTFTAWVN